MSGKYFLRLLLNQNILNLSSAIASGKVSPKINSGEYLANMLEGI
jgi:hypothetical protein